MTVTPISDEAPDTDWVLEVDAFTAANDIVVPLYARKLIKQLWEEHCAAHEWRQARKAVLQEPTPDVRTSETFRAALDRLAAAEGALYNLKGVAP